MRIHKYKSALFAALALSLLLCACGGQGDGTDTTPGSTTDVPLTTDTTTQDAKANVSFVQDGKMVFSVIRADKADKVQQDIAIGMRTKLLGATGLKECAIGTDWKRKDAEYDATTYEILVGDTDYPQTAELKEQLAWNEYGVVMIDNKIVVTAHSLQGVRLAVSEFAAMVKKAVNTSAGDGNVVLDMSEPKIGKVPALSSSLPAYEGGNIFGGFDCGDGEREFIIENTTQAEFDAYIGKLAEAGYTKTSETKLAGNTYVYMKGPKGTMVYAYFSPRSGKASVLCGTDTVTDIQIPSEGKVCEPLLTQGGAGNNSGAMGMSYLIRLEDSSFIVIDGGYNTNGESEELYRKMTEQNVRKDGQILIRAWVITHAHADHYNTMRAFISTYASRITVEHVIFNPLASVYQENSDTPSAWDVKNGSTSFAGSDCVKAHAGQVFSFPGCSMEVLYSAEDCFDNPYYVAKLNNASMVVRLVIADEVILFPGDMEKDGAAILCAMYGEYLKCDILQIAHHGYYGGSEEFYGFASPTVAMWPVMKEQSNKWNTSIPVNKYWLSLPSLKQTVVAADGAWTVTLPYYPE